MPELSEEELDALVEDATVDAYNDEEQLGGFAVMMWEDLNTHASRAMRELACPRQYLTAPG